MNAPFQSVGIIFLVTIVHVVVIAIYSSRTLPESTFQRSIVMPDVESLEVMPEQLVRDTSVLKADTPPESCLESLQTGDLVDSDRVNDEETLKEWAKVVTPENIPGKNLQKKKEAEPEVSAPEQVVKEEAVETDVVKVDVAPVIRAERWEDNDFAKRVSYPHLDGILGRKSRKLAENKSDPASKVERKTTAKEPAPRSRSFSPIPRS